MMASSSDQLAVMRPAYMSLPSPNITCPEEEQEKQMLEDPHSWSVWNTSCELEEDSADGAVSLPLERRGALVPPKIDLSGTSSSGSERTGRESSCSSYSLSSRQDDLTSSVAVIPPMQICPGDLLVYSRVLAHKASGYGGMRR